MDWMINDFGLISPLAPFCQEGERTCTVFFSFLIWPLDPDPVLR